MAPFTAFLVYELRRCAPTVLAGWSLWLMLFLVHRLVVGHWRFWAEGDFAMISAGAMILVVAPLLAVALVFSGWPQERSAGQYRWLLARPLPKCGLFLGRLLAIAVSIGVYVCGALVLNGISPLRILSAGIEPVEIDYDLTWMAWSFLAGWPLLAWLVISLALIALAVLISVLSRSPGGAVGWWVLTTAAIVGMAVAFQVYLQRIGQDSWWQTEAVSRYLLKHDVLWLVGLILAAWGVFRHSTTGPVRGLRGLLWGVVPALLALMMLGRLLAQPTTGKDSRTILARAVEGGTLELNQGSYTRRSVSMLRLHRDDGTFHFWSDLPVAWMGLRLAPDRQRAFIRGGDDYGIHLLDLKSLETTPIGGNAVVNRQADFLPGWSPGSERFVWLDSFRKRSRLVSIELDGRLRSLEMPVDGHLWELIWIDDSKLLATWMTHDAEGRFFGNCHWGVLSLPDASLDGPPRRCGGKLQWIGNSAGAFGNMLSTAGEFGGRQAVCQEQDGACGLGLFDPISGEVEPIGVRLPWGYGGSLGVGAGGLVWLEQRGDGRRLVRSWRPETGVTSACVLPARSVQAVHSQHSSFTSFLASNDGWAVWQDLTRSLAQWQDSPGQLLACQLATGEVQVIDSPRLGIGSAELFEGSLILPGKRVSLGD